MKAKRKKCKVCKNSFEPKQFAQIVCSYGCALSYSKQKTKEKETKEWKVKKAIMKDKVTNYAKELQKEINKIVRLIDKNLPCLARGNYPNQIHAAHIYARGGNQSIRYNLHNIHRQSAQSNHFQNDDGLLREGLINEYGEEYMEFISQLRQTPKLTYNNIEYKEFTEKARSIIRRLEKFDYTYWKENRIIMRNKINMELGIYSEIYCNFLL